MVKELVKQMDKERKIKLVRNLQRIINDYLELLNEHQKDI
jgi:hypothetical protein